MNCVLPKSRVNGVPSDVLANEPSCQMKLVSILGIRSRCWRNMTTEMKAWS